MLGFYALSEHPFGSEGIVNVVVSVALPSASATAPNAAGLGVANVIATAGLATANLNAPVAEAIAGGLAQALIGSLQATPALSGASGSALAQVSFDVDVSAGTAPNAVAAGTATAQGLVGIVQVSTAQATASGSALAEVSFGQGVSTAPEATGKGSSTGLSDLPVVTVSPVQGVGITFAIPATATGTIGTVTSAPPAAQALGDANVITLGPVASTVAPTALVNATALVEALIGSVAANEPIFTVSADANVQVSLADSLASSAPTAGATGGATAESQINPISATAPDAAAIGNASANAELFALLATAPQGDGWVLYFFESDRVVYVTAESRALTVTSETRSFTITAEGRFLALGDESRTIAVANEPRILEAANG